MRLPCAAFFLLASAACSDIEITRVPMSAPPVKTCNELCASKGMRCNDEAFEDPDGNTGGQTVYHSCATCYSQTVWYRCDGTPLGSKGPEKTGPVTENTCGCSP